MGTKAERWMDVVEPGGDSLGWPLFLSELGSKVSWMEEGIEI